jgi:hypothetical protein
MENMAPKTTKLWLECTCIRVQTFWRRSHNTAGAVEMHCPSYGNGTGTSVPSHQHPRLLACWQTTVKQPEPLAHAPAAFPTFTAPATPSSPPTFSCGPLEISVEGQPVHLDRAPSTTDNRRRMVPADASSLRIRTTTQVRHGLAVAIGHERGRSGRRRGWQCAARDRVHIAG